MSRCTSSNLLSKTTETVRRNFSQLKKSRDYISRLLTNPKSSNQLKATIAQVTGVDIKRTKEITDTTFVLDDPYTKYVTDVI